MRLRGVLHTSHLQAFGDYCEACGYTETLKECKYEVLRMSNDGEQVAVCTMMNDPTRVAVSSKSCKLLREFIKSRL